MPDQDNVPEGVPHDNLQEFYEEAAQLHNSVKEARKKRLSAWYTEGKRLLEIKEKGLWKAWVGEGETFNDYCMSPEVNKNKTELSRLLRWIKVAKQIGLDEEDHQKVTESKVLRCLLQAVKYEPDGETVLNRDKVRELFFAAQNYSWRDFHKMCKEERKRHDPNERIKKDNRFKKFAKGTVYDGHGHSIGSIKGVNGRAKSQYLKIRLDTTKIPEKGPVTIIVPESLRRYKNQ